MKKILIALIAMCCVLSPAHAITYDQAVATLDRYQTPCKEVGNVGIQVCVVRHKYLSGNQPVVSTTIIPMKSNPFIAKYKTFSVICVYHVRPGGLNDDIGVNIRRGSHGVMLAPSVAKPALVWITTHDGGRTWSNPTTTDMGSVISY